MSKDKPKGAKKFWPSWRYHESRPEGQIFQSAEDVPAGWVDHPSKIGAAPPTAVPVPAPVASGRKSKAEKDEERRLALLAEARKKFGDIVPDTATIAELESSLNGNGS